MQESGSKGGSKGGRERDTEIERQRLRERERERERERDRDREIGRGGTYWKTVAAHDSAVGLSRGLRLRMMSIT